MNILGIDPGLKGAGVILSCERKVLSTFCLPVKDKKIHYHLLELKLREVCAVYEPTIYLEEPYAMGMGVSGAFSFGRGFASVEIAAEKTRETVIYVRPSDWAREIHEGIDKRFKPKEKSLIAYKKLFPRVNLIISKRSKKPHEGLVDALLIAEYGRRKEANAA